MQGSDEWRVNNANGRQGVHAKPPYPGIGRCSAKLYPCPLPVSANQVSMSPVVVPGRDAALMEFEESSIDFLSPQLPADFSTVRWNTPLGEVIVPGSALGEGNEDEVIKPSRAEACDIVPPLVLWEELFNASEDYFASGGGGTDSEKASVEVAPVPVGFPVSDVCRPVPSGTLVFLTFVSLLVAVGVAGLLCAVFG